jgi:hypothetical protein
LHPSCQAPAGVWAVLSVYAASMHSSISPLSLPHYRIRLI